MRGNAGISEAAAGAWAWRAKVLQRKRAIGLKVTIRVTGSILDLNGDSTG
jgi:hypothetical protein